MTENYFKVLKAINVSDKVEQKNGLNYLSWAYAWGALKEIHPTATYKIYENPDGWNYWTDGRTCWVKTSVTVEGIEHIEYLPVLDFKNQAILLDKVTSFNVNTSIQRSLTKCIGRHGLGLNIYAGEDLPKESKDDETPKKQTATAKKNLYKERMDCLNRTTTSELWDKVKALKDTWVLDAEKTYGEDYANQMNDKFIELAKKFQPVEELLDDEIKY
jgi:hypothetical protein